MATTVYVDGISSHTSDDEIKSFFSFCGKIADLKVSASSTDNQSATVEFEKPAAAKTALLLDNTQLGPNSVHVTAGKSIDDVAEGHVAADDGTSKDAHDVEQEDKPRGRIIAEYLAHGYVISDNTIKRAIELDQQHGISTRFTNALKAFDGRFQATQKAQAVDTRFGVTEKAMAGWRGMTSYFDKVTGTPTGQKLRRFYEDGSKQVIDVHNEARHLANLKASNQPGAISVEQIPGTDKTKCNCGSVAERCSCEPGKCACTDCAKSSEKAGGLPAGAAASLQQVPGTDKTTCNCGANAELCSCEKGKCACDKCPKA